MNIKPLLDIVLKIALMLAQSYCDYLKATKYDEDKAEV